MAAAGGQEIITYEAPWDIYAANWSHKGDVLPTHRSRRPLPACSACPSRFVASIEPVRGTGVYDTHGFSGYRTGSQRQMM